MEIFLKMLRLTYSDHLALIEMNRDIIRFCGIKIIGEADQRFQYSGHIVALSITSSDMLRTTIQPGSIVRAGGHGRFAPAT